MEAAELDVQLEELEIRLERLRALYEQYFLGIEKLEPAVARKDVDRRIYVLRREKIRNTGKRFKLQTIIQRYNTFQQYWHRICREIENGTYKRHVLRAERSFGPGELLTIAARKRFGREREARASAPAPAPAESPPPVEASPPPPVRPAAASPPPPPVRPAAASPPPPPVRPAAASPPPPAVAPALPAAARRASTKPQQFESLDLDMDFLGDWDPSAKPAPAPKKPAEPVKRSEPPARAPAPAVAKSAPAAAAPAPAPAPTRSAPPSPIPVRAARKPLPRAEPKPEPEPAPAPVPRPAAASPALDEARIRDLHGRLNDLKRKNQEAGQVSLEGLAKSLRAAEEKLRQQHAGRRIDFDVVVKDGRAVVKPIVR